MSIVKIRLQKVTLNFHRRNGPRCFERELWAMGYGVGYWIIVKIVKVLPTNPKPLESLPKIDTIKATSGR